MTIQIASHRLNRRAVLAGGALTVSFVLAGARTIRGTRPLPLGFNNVT